MRGEVSEIFVFDGTSSGNVAVNVDPVPAPLVTVMLALIIWQDLRESARPAFLADGLA